MSAHTPGPWCRAWVKGALRHINRNVDTEAFFEGPVPDGENTPNVRINAADADLIAAAPDLLAALKELVARRQRVTLGRGLPALADSDGRYARAVAAIAKAEGRP